MRSSSDSCIRQRGIDSTKNEERKCNPCCGKKTPKLFVIGTGPGNSDHMSLRAHELLKKSDCIAGYSTYIDLIKDVIENKPVIATGMTKEVERVKAAISKAMSGTACALISGGDAGVYAMAGLVFEICSKKELKLVRYGSNHGTDNRPENRSDSKSLTRSDHNSDTNSDNESNYEPDNNLDNEPGYESDNESCSKSDQKGNLLEIEIVPGIPALASGAALLGAPLTHDFAAVSLSDLLTPWEKIEKRIDAVASADFVIVIYNPKSKKRNWQLGKAQEIILRHRDKDTPVGIVTAAMRNQQQVSITPLKDIDKAEVGMQTTLFIGNSSSVEYMDFMYTPRGYAGKYTL